MAYPIQLASMFVDVTLTTSTGAESLCFITALLARHRCTLSPVHHERCNGKMQNGPLTGSYVRDVGVSVYDGKIRPVDNNDISFKIAGLQAFRQAFQLADPRYWNRFTRLKSYVPMISRVR